MNIHIITVTAANFFSDKKNLDESICESSSPRFVDMRNTEKISGRGYLKMSL